MGMKDVMIPAYESATRQMFQQTSSTLEKGLAQITVNQSSEPNEAMEAMQSQIIKMNEMLQTLSSEVIQLRDAVVASANHAESSPTQPVVQQQPPTIRDKITELCRANRFEEAFTKAVSASDGEVVLFACKSCDITAVFANTDSISQ